MGTTKISGIRCNPLLREADFCLDLHCVQRLHQMAHPARPAPLHPTRSSRRESLAADEDKRRTVSPLNQAGNNQKRLGCTILEIGLDWGASNLAPEREATSVMSWDFGLFPFRVREQSSFCSRHVSPCCLLLHRFHRLTLLWN